MSPEESEPRSEAEPFEWTDHPAPAAEQERSGPGVMIPERGRRPAVETVVMRLVATAGIIGIGVAIAAIMHSQKSQGWLIGLVVSIVSVLLAGVLWSSRRL